jgi:hypothetical protein
LLVAVVVRTHTQAHALAEMAVLVISFLEVQEQADHLAVAVAAVADVWVLDKMQI